MNKTIRVRVIPNAKKNEISDYGCGYKIHLTAPPVGGKANKALIEFLANYYNVKKSQINIIRGQKIKDKIIEIG